VHLAQLNIAEALHPMDDPRMGGFTSRIETINALADRSPGFIWRMVDDDDSLDGALGIRFPGGSEDMIVNMSVWADVMSLYNFVYKTAHLKLIDGKTDWFETPIQKHMVLWWVEDGHIPTLDEARQKLEALRENGPASDAFSFASPFDPRGDILTIEIPKKETA